MLPSVKRTVCSTRFWIVTSRRILGPCDACDARFRCPVKFNVDTFRLRSVVGLPDREAKEVKSHNACARAARSRLKSVFQMLHFRKRIHVTVRDLRSYLRLSSLGNTPV